MGVYTEFKSLHYNWISIDLGGNRPRLVKSSILELKKNVDCLGIWELGFVNSWSHIYVCNIIDGEHWFKWLLGHREGGEILYW